MTQESTDQMARDPALSLLPARAPSVAVAARPSRALHLRVWAVRRPCSGRDAGTWFPPEMAVPGSSQTAVAAYARAACLGCTVRDECLELALRAEAEPGVAPEGMLGGTAPWEREIMLRARAAARQAVAS